MQQPHKPTQMHLWIYELNMLPHPCSGCYNILVYELGWCLTNSLTIFPNIQLSKVAVYHLVYKFEQISEDHPYRKICWHIQQLLYQTCCYDLMLFFWLHNLHRKVNLFCSNDVHQHLICIRFLIPVNIFWLKKSQVIIWIHLYLVIHCFSVCWKGDSVVMNPQ